jgi:hypothetical protein
LTGAGILGLSRWISSLDTLSISYPSLVPAATPVRLPTGS